MNVAGHGELAHAAGDQLNELAYHFCRAAPLADLERAVDYCTRAAEHALHVLAFEQAVCHYQNALAALGCRLPIDEERRFALKPALGTAQFRAGEDGNPALLSAAEIARRLERPELVAEVALSMLGRRAFGATAGPITPRSNRCSKRPCTRCRRDIGCARVSRAGARSTVRSSCHSQPSARSAPKGWRSHAKHRPKMRSTMPCSPKCA